MRKLLGAIFAAEPDFTVEFARNGTEALAQLPAFKPDVITLDIHMPDMDGLACLDRIMIERPCPVVMVSSLTAEGAAQTLEALELGAIDFVTKPQGAISLEMQELAPHLVEIVRRASQARMRPTLRLAERIRLRNDRLARPSAPAMSPTPGKSVRRARSKVAPRAGGIVLIGTSTGGPPALDAVLSPLPAEFPWPIVVAQHMPASFTASLARRLDGICALSVSEVGGITPVEAGNVYIGRGDADVLVSVRDGVPVVMAAPSSPNHRWHPSVDRLVTSALEHVEAERLLGILMTGMGNDGAAAMTRMKAAGGRTIAEAEETAVVWGMPGELVKAGGASIVAPLDDIASRLLEFVWRP